MKTVDEREAILRARLAELDKNMHKIEDQLDEPADKDVEERAVERELDEVLEGIGNVEMAEAQAINAALERINDGTYGYCVECGEKITEERLDAVPYAPKCQKCAA